MYLLDTRALSDYLKGEPNTLARLKQEKPANIFISTITVFEMNYGLRLKPSLIEKIVPQYNAICEMVEIVDFSTVEAAQAAKIRKDLKQAGRLIGAYDLLIAAIPVTNKLTLVTSNTKEFSRVNNLVLDNWRN